MSTVATSLDISRWTARNSPNKYFFILIRLHKNPKLGFPCQQLNKWALYEVHTSSIHLVHQRLPLSQFLILLSSCCRFFPVWCRTECTAAQGPYRSPGSPIIIPVLSITPHCCWLLFFLVTRVLICAFFIWATVCRVKGPTFNHPNHGSLPSWGVGSTL